MTVTYLPRDGWDDSGAPRSGYIVPDTQFVGLVVHHTVTIHAPKPGIGDEVAHMRLLRTIRPDLSEDVPYTAVVFRGVGPDDAVLAEGRGPGRTGAHTSGFNSSRYGVAYAGNSITDPMTPAVLEAFRLAGRMWLPRASVATVGHGQLPDQGTACPGTWLRDHMSDLQPPFAEVLAPAEPPEQWSTTVAANRIDLCGVGVDGGVYHQFSDLRKNDGKWSAWSRLGGLVTDHPPEVVWHRDWLHFFGVERGTGRVMQLSWHDTAGAWAFGGAWYPVAGAGTVITGVSAAVGL